MRKIYLQRLEQNGKSFYTFMDDPRNIVRLLPTTRPGELQDVQRPFKLSRVMDISGYVAGQCKKPKLKKVQGLIPNNPILVLTSRLKVQSETVRIIIDGMEHEETWFFLHMPEKDEEYTRFTGAIKVLDGQHRLHAFEAEYRHPEFADSMRYELAFTVFDCLTDREILELFYIVTQKAEKVSSNLSHQQLFALDVLEQEERRIYELLLNLNHQTVCPLCGRIVVGAEVISRGYTASQLSKIIDTSGTMSVLEELASTLDDPDDCEKMMTNVLSNYLRAWEHVFGVSFQMPDRRTVTKISGLRYILHLFPEFSKQLERQRILATQDNIAMIIRELQDALGCKDIFVEEALAFSGESSTIALAKRHANSLNTHLSCKTKRFSPVIGI